MTKTTYTESNGLLVPSRRKFFFMSAAVIAAGNLMPGHSIANILVPPPAPYRSYVVRETRDGVIEYIGASSEKDGGLPLFESLSRNEFIRQARMAVNFDRHLLKTDYDRFISRPWPLRVHDYSWDYTGESPMKNDLVLRSFRHYQSETANDYERIDKERYEAFRKVVSVG